MVYVRVDNESNVREDAVVIPLGEGENGARMGLPHVDGPLGSETPIDDAAIGIASEKIGVAADKVHTMDLGSVAAENAGGQGGWQGGRVSGDSHVW